MFSVTVGVFSCSMFSLSVINKCFDPKPSCSCVVLMGGSSEAT